MKLKDLSLRHVAVIVPAFTLVAWVVFQFAILPNVTEGQREHLYSGSGSTPYLYAMNIAFICFAIWFVFSYRGPLATPERKTVIFAIALGSVCGMLLTIAIRLTWHI